MMRKSRLVLRKEEEEEERGKRRAMRVHKHGEDITH